MTPFDCAPEPPASCGDGAAAPSAADAPAAVSLAGRPAAYTATGIPCVAPGARVGHEAGRDFVPVDPRGEDGVLHCWELRGCAGTFGFTDYMEAECPHNVPDRYSPCPATCAFTRCQRPWHVEATSLEDLLDPTVDRMAANKDQCRHCMHFIRLGPRANAENPQR